MHSGHAWLMVANSTVCVVGRDESDVRLVEGLPLKPKRVVLLNASHLDGRSNGSVPTVSVQDLVSLKEVVDFAVPVLCGRDCDLLAHADKLVKLSPMLTIVYWQVKPDKRDARLTLLCGRALTKFRKFTVHSRLSEFKPNGYNEIDFALALLTMRKSGNHDVVIENDTLKFAGDPIRRWLYNRLGITELVYRYHLQNPKVLTANRTDLLRLIALIQAGALYADRETTERLFRLKSEIGATLPRAPYITPSDLARFAELVQNPEVLHRADGKVVPVTILNRMKTERTEVLTLHDDGLVSFTPVERYHTKLVAYLPKEYQPDTYSEDDIQAFVQRFELPNVPTVSDVAPSAYAKACEALDVIESIIRDRTGQQLFAFQRHDIAALLAKGYGILGWDPGLGKTVAGLCFALGAIHLGAKPRVLIVCPQDLVAQWLRETEKFFGQEFAEEFILVRNVEDAIRLLRLSKLVPKHIPLYAITWYEALRSSVGEDQPIQRECGEPCLLCRRIIRQRVQRHHEVELVCSDGCPYNGVPYRLRSRDAAWFLKKFVRGGVLVVDEATYIKSDTSQRGIAARRLVTAKFRLLLTGTPIKNLISDLPMLLQLAAKPNSDAYPFPAESEGIHRFSKQFMVVERNLDTGRRRLGPEPTNIAVAQRLLSAIILRRTKDQTGETLVPLSIQMHKVPMTSEQAAWYKAWCDDELFEWWFRETHNKELHPLAKLLSRMSHLLFVTSHPTAPTAVGHPIKLSQLTKRLTEPTEYTHKNRLVIDLAVKSAKEFGHCVLFVQTVGIAKFFAQEIVKRGIPVHLTMTVNKQGKVASLPPSKRSQIIAEFRQHGGVMIASISAMAHGHDLAFVNRAIIHSLPFAYDHYAQAIMRVHRIVSERPVEVHVLCCANTIDEYLFDLLQRKEAAAKQVLAGAVIEPSVGITAEEWRKLWEKVQENAEAIVVE